MTFTMNMKCVAIVVLTAAFCGTPLVAVETVRVGTSEGVPQLLVDGKPVRARMFWGAPGRGQLSIGPEAKKLIDLCIVNARIKGVPPGNRALSPLIGPSIIGYARVNSFEFSPTVDEPGRATMHFRFGSTPGDIYLDDIRVVDLKDNTDVLPACDFESGIEGFRKNWTLWPIGPANTVGKVEVQPGRGRDGSAGTPYGQYLLDDVTAGRVDAKMFVFLNAWCLSPDQRQQILNATRGKLRI